VLLLCTSVSAPAAVKDMFVTGGGLYRVDGATGALVYNNSFGPTFDVTFGPDANAYVSTGDSLSIVRVNPSTGALIDTFAYGGDYLSGLAFGPDGNLYAAAHYTGQILRFNGVTGASMGIFASGGDLSQPGDILFGPDHNLYVWDLTGNVLRYNGTTGAPMGIFAAHPSSESLEAPSMAFGRDGNLYLAGTSNQAIYRFDGVTGADLGALASYGPAWIAAGLLFALRHGVWE
jgi:outer membrane protein assembly factor BamB